MNKLLNRCVYCGNTNLWFRASVLWDIDKQEYGDVMEIDENENPYCPKCDEHVGFEICQLVEPV